MFSLIISILILAWCVYALYLTNDAKKICDRMLDRLSKIKYGLTDIQKDLKNVNSRSKKGKDSKKG